MALLARTDNDHGFACELLNLFVRSASETLTQLAESLQNVDDPEDIRKMAQVSKDLRRRRRPKPWRPAPQIWARLGWTPEKGSDAPPLASRTDVAKSGTIHG